MIGDIEIGVASRAPRLDNRPLKKRIGLVILATDHTSEPDFARMVASADIGIYVSRIHYANPTTPENLRAMQPSLTTGAGLILPGEPLDAIMYSCTSASVVIGDEEVTAAIRKAKPGVSVVMPTAAAVLGLKAFGARNISVLTPYTIETSRPMADYFSGLGFGIDRFTCLGMTDDREMARVAPSEIVAFAKEAFDTQSDALFISCTALRAAGVAVEIEQAIGKPVVTSNLATAWQCLRLCGDQSSRSELGRLMTMQLPGA
jgi:maleate isomerase